MEAITFELPVRDVESAPTRADVACFVGLIQPRSIAAHALDTPHCFDRWEEFAAAFTTTDTQGTLVPVASAVRAFFEQGGRRCRVVAVSDQPGKDETAFSQGTLEDRLCPRALSASAPETWVGVGALYAARDASFVAFPDLPTRYASEPPTTPAAEPRPARPAVFVPCGRVTAERVRPPVRGVPRADRGDYRRWARFLDRVCETLRAHFRDVLCVAAVPLPFDADLRAQGDLRGILLDAGVPRSAFLQLAWPWLLREGGDEVETPEGFLLGLLARNALLRGTWRSAAAGVPSAIVDGSHVVSRAQAPVAELVSLFGPTPSGWRLLSDVTTSSDAAWRPAGVSRLMGAVYRCARLVGDDVAFEPNGERTWAALRRRVEVTLREMRARGAFRGATEAESFDVRCGRATMTQNDIDAGRLIVRVEVWPARAIERVTVTLVLQTGEAP